MTTIGNGQTLNVSSSQTSSGVVVLSGGTVNVLSGGTVSNTVDDGVVNVSGTAISTTVSSGGFYYVDAGGSATATVVSAFGSVLPSARPSIAAVRRTSAPNHPNSSIVIRACQPTGEICHDNVLRIIG
jgi:autotransporter passenger strand-loop-strand repeat protein